LIDVLQDLDDDGVNELVLSDEDFDDGLDDFNDSDLLGLLLNFLGSCGDKSLVNRLLDVDNFKDVGVVGLLRNRILVTDFWFFLFGSLGGGCHNRFNWNNLERNNGISVI
jgi:hypothetical protein